MGPKGHFKLQVFKEIAIFYNIFSDNHIRQVHLQYYKKTV